MREGRQRTVCQPRVRLPLHGPRRLSDLLERAARHLRLDLDARGPGQEEAEVDVVAVAVTVRAHGREQRPVAQKRMVGGDGEIPRLGNGRPRRGNRVRVRRRPLDRRRQDEQRQDQDPPAKSAHPTQLMHPTRRCGLAATGPERGQQRDRRDDAQQQDRDFREDDAHAAARHRRRPANATASRGRAAPRRAPVLTRIALP